jgi:hypothetical protein
MKETKELELASGLRFGAVFIDGKLDSVTVTAPSRRLVITNTEVEEVSLWLGKLTSTTLAVGIAEATKGLPGSPQTVATDSLASQGPFSERRAVKRGVSSDSHSQQQSEQLSPDVVIEDFSNKLEQPIRVRIK